MPWIPSLLGVIEEKILYLKYYRPPLGLSIFWKWKQFFDFRHLFKHFYPLCHFTPSDHWSESELWSGNSPSSVWFRIRTSIYSFNVTTFTFRTDNIYAFCDDAWIIIHVGKRIDEKIALFKKGTFFITGWHINPKFGDSQKLYYGCGNFTFLKIMLMYDILTTWNFWIKYIFLFSKFYVSTHANFFNYSQI